MKRNNEYKKKKSKPLRRQSKEPTGLSEASRKVQALSRKGRRVVGIHSCQEVIKVRPHAIHSIYLKKGFESHEDLIFFKNWAEENNVDVFIESEAFFKKMAQVHQGVCFIVNERPRFDESKVFKKEKSAILILDGIEDPHNLGAVLRSAWLMGVDAIYIPENRSSPLTSTALKVACGGAEHVPVIEEVNLPRVIKLFKENGYWVYGLSHRGASHVQKVDYHEKSVFVLGSEDKGIRLPLERECDLLVKLPQTSEQASYNASVACALTCFEYFRQHPIN